jgi:hypothetical protein
MNGLTYCGPKLIEANKESYFFTSNFFLDQNGTREIEIVGERKRQRQRERQKQRQKRE